MGSWWFLIEPLAEIMTICACFTNSLTSKTEALSWILTRGSSTTHSRGSRTELRPGESALHIARARARHAESRAQLTYTTSNGKTSSQVPFHLCFCACVLRVAKLKSPKNSLWAWFPNKAKFIKECWHLFPSSLCNTICIAVLAKLTVGQPTIV